MPEETQKRISSTLEAILGKSLEEIPERPYAKKSKKTPGKIMGGTLREIESNYEKILIFFFFLVNFKVNFKEEYKKILVKIQKREKSWKKNTRDISSLNSRQNP